MSEALLSVFMDKKARKILYAKRTTKDKPTVSSNIDPYVAPTKSVNDPLSAMDHDKISTLVKDSLNTPEDSVVDKKKLNTLNKTSKSADCQNREDLIENALVIFKSKSHIIDELPTEQQKKLKLLAFQLFSEQLKDG